MLTFPQLVERELERARSLHNPQQSAHEAYAVILEELDEFWEEVRAKQQDAPNMLKELVQVAAMAQRAAEDLNLITRPSSDVPGCSCEAMRELHPGADF